MPRADAVPGGRPGDEVWRAAEFDRLLGFAEAALVPGRGFGWLDDDGRLDPNHPFELWITARMTHVFSLAALRGRPGADGLAAAGVEHLSQSFADAEHGGWFRSVDAAGRPVDAAKACYEHAFVLLASSSATAAQVPGAGELFASASEIITGRFWRTEEQRCVERYDRTWSALEAYRGANSNMHSVEAFLAAAGAAPRGRGSSARSPSRRTSSTAPPGPTDGACPSTTTSNGNRSPTTTATVPATRSARSGHPGPRPGMGPAVRRPGRRAPGSPPWLVEAAEGLFATAVTTAWAVDGHDGFVYTVDWSDRPVVSERMHWVAAEAVLAADALHRRTGDDRYRTWSERWWAHIERDFVDRERGSWHHELDRELRPSSRCGPASPMPTTRPRPCCCPDYRSPPPRPGRCAPADAPGRSR